MVLLALVHVLVVWFVLDHLKPTRFAVEPPREAGPARVVKIVDVDQFADHEQRDLALLDRQQFIKGGRTRVDIDPRRGSWVQGRVGRGKRVAKARIGRWQGMSKEHRGLHQLYGRGSTAFVRETERASQFIKPSLLSLDGQSNDPLGVRTLGDDAKLRKFGDVQFSDDQFRPMRHHDRFSGRLGTPASDAQLFFHVFKLSISDPLLGTADDGLVVGNRNLFSRHPPEERRKNSGRNRRKNEWGALASAAVGFLGYVLLDEWSWYLRLNNPRRSRLLWWGGGAFLLTGLGLPFWWLL